MNIDAVPGFLWRTIRVCGSMSCLLLLVAGCDLRQRMFDQPKYEPLERSAFFDDGLSSRQPVPGTVARGQLRLDTHFHQGTIEGELATSLPAAIELDYGLLKRGQERYDIFCAPCHDRTGRGNGMIVQRGLKQPASLHEDRMREAPIGHFYDVITNGFGAMYSYASRIPAEDRWAIAAYIRALQFSQNAEFEQLPEADQRQLQ